MNNGIDYLEVCHGGTVPKAGDWAVVSLGSQEQRHSAYMK